MFEKWAMWWQADFCVDKLGRESEVRDGAKQHLSGFLRVFSYFSEFFSEASLSCGLVGRESERWMWSDLGGKRRLEITRPCSKLLAHPLPIPQLTTTMPTWS